MSVVKELKTRRLALKTADIRDLRVEWKRSDLLWVGAWYTCTNKNMGGGGREGGYCRCIFLYFFFLAFLFYWSTVSFC